MTTFSRLPLTLGYMICLLKVARAASTLDCDFEDVNICGYTHDATDDFDWTWFSGPTSSHDTGPSNDHTFASSRGHYMYIEATPLGNGHTGRLISPTYTPLSTPQCLEFWYHMHGEDIGTLTAYFERGGQYGSAQFNVQGNKGNSWFLAQINIAAGAQPFQLIIQGTSTGSYRGDIGIDDIAIKPWRCGGGPSGPDQAVLNPPQSNTVMQEYDLLTVVCTCGNCVPSCNVQWKIGNLNITNSSSLRLENVLRTSTGRYTCTCTNPASLKSTSKYFDLQVWYGPDEAALTPNNTTYTLLEFSSISPVRCYCGVCEPRCKTQWTFKGSNISGSVNGSLDLKAVTRHSAGKYKCTCINPSTATSETKSLIINVLYGPGDATLIPATETYVHEELSFMPPIACFCGECYPECAVEWAVNGTYISNDSILNLGYVTRNTTGRYLCTCTNPSTQLVDTQHFNLSVQYGPDDATLIPATVSYTHQELSPMSPIACFCGECQPECDIQWTVNGIYLSNDSILNLGNVTRNAKGQYICSCTNPSTQKVETQHFNLSVQYGPDDATLIPATETYTHQELSSMSPIACFCGGCQPECIIQWTVNGTYISNDSILNLGNVARNTTGRYICTCTNPSTQKEVTKQFNLSVQYGPDEAALTPASTNYVVHESSLIAPVTCGCGLCKPECISLWTLNGIVVNNSENGILDLKAVSRYAAGQYFCTCKNPATLREEKRELNVTVLFGPDDVSFIPVADHYTLEEWSSMPPVACYCGTCEPRCIVKWTVNGTVVSNNSVLELGNVTRDAENPYVCSCTNPSTKKQERQQFALAIQYGPDDVKLTTTKTTYILSEFSSFPEVTCDCGVCEPRCRTQWTFNGPDESYTIIDDLYMGNLTQNSTGQYVCTCTNPATLKQDKKHLHIIVQYGPDAVFITPSIDTYNIEEGSSLPEITCTCGNCEPSCLTQWLFNGEVIGNTSSLEVSNVSRADTGSYTCKCLNPATLKEEETEIKVVVKHGPDDVRIQPNLTSYTKTVGSELGKITCTCDECMPTCKVEWARNNVTVSQTGILYFKRLSEGDSGEYICTCMNSETLLTESKHIHLVVNALPNIQPCPGDTDAWDTTWQETPAGEEVTKDCKGNGYTGSISRVCTTTGRWLIPKYNCIRSSFADVESKLTKNVSQSDVSDALNKLADLTNTKENDTEMYAGEIESVTRTLDVVATLAKSGLPPTEEQSKSFIKIASNLLSEDKKRSWESLSQSETGGGGSKLLQSVDSLSEAITKTLEDTNASVISISQPNIVLEARKVDMSQDEIKYPMSPQTKKKAAFAGAKLSLPLQHGSATEFKSYTVTLYKSLAGVLPDSSASRDGDEDVGNLKLNSRVVSLQTFPYRSELSNPLTLIFDHDQPHFRSAECSYWSFLGNHWATQGCHVESSDGTRTVCVCYHLTNFAVLMSPWSEPTADSTAIEIISIVGCSVSIVCLIATAALHLAHWRYIKNDRAVILINICSALLVTYTIFLAGINQTSNKAACTAVAALLHYILLVVFCLMLAEGIEITITVKFVFVKKSRIKWMIPLAWGIPAVIVGLSMGITKLSGYGTENFCWLSVDRGVIWAFVGPALLVIVANVVFLAILLRTMLKTKAYMEMTDIERIKCSARCLCVLVPLMGCTWVLGILYVNDRTTWMQYIFALCNSLQGFFIFLFHGLLNKQLRTAMRSRYKKYKDSHSLSTSHSVTKSHSTRRTEVTCALNPVYSSTAPIETKSDPVKKYGRKFSLQFMKTGSYSPMGQEKQ